MLRDLSALLLPCLCLAGPAAEPAPSLDRYGGIERVAATRTGSFHVEKVADRWWIVTPDGHGMFIRAVSKIDTSDYGGSGGSCAYDGVYLETATGAMSPNLRAAAESTVARDLVHPATNATLKEKGDAIYLGSSRWKPNFTYFWLDQLGRGGQVTWHYATAAGWKPINGTGKPHKGEALDGGGWHLDTGNFMAPDENGFGQWGNRNANRIAWWDMSRGFPSDLAATSLPGDRLPRYYIKGVVTREFATAPILSQAYERADLGEWIARKYGPGDSRRAWAAAMSSRLRSWGFNAAGQYSYAYVAAAARLSEPLPVEPTWALGGWATRGDRPYRAKNVYAGAVFPPGSRNPIYQGLQPDVFDPAFERAYRELVRTESLPDPRWSWALIAEEADYLFGINSLTHDHLGYVVLSQNPYHPRAQVQGREISYEDPRLHAKYALRDFLRNRHASIENLNSAWGTAYTTWDSSSGDLLKGDNAWGTGTGFMDENGTGVIAPGVRSIGFSGAFTDPAHPAIRKDLDDFVKLFAARYGAVLQAAFGQITHPVLLLPVYNGPDFVYEALAPHVDGFWISISDPKDALRIYRAGRKPLLVADYLAADPDSPLYFNVAIDSLRHDAASDTTRIEARDLRYVFRAAQCVAFPDCPALLDNYQRLGKPYPYPRVKAARWNAVELAGDYTGFVKPGMHLELYKDGHYPYERRTQEDRARDMIKLYRELLDLRGDDGVSFVIGIEHWCLYDPAVSNWGDNQNFGLATLQDNAYDGVEARRASGADAQGRPIGGEDADYGNLAGALGPFLRSIDERLSAAPPGSGRPDRAE